MKIQIKTCSEHQEQAAIKKWCSTQPILKDYFVHIVNEGKRSIGMGSKFKDAGLRPGVSDNIIPYPVGLLHGFWGEMKRTDGSLADLRPNQREWLLRMHDIGYRAVVAFGWEQMKMAIEDYMANTEIEQSRRNISFSNKTRIWVYR